MRGTEGPLDPFLSFIFTEPWQSDWRMNLRPQPFSEDLLFLIDSVCNSKRFLLDSLAKAVAVLNTRSYQINHSTFHGFSASRSDSVMIEMRRIVPELPSLFLLELPV